MQELDLSLIVYLNKHSTVSAKEICSLLKISQASFSRVYEKSKERILKIGSARNSLYALKREIQGLENGIPVFKIGLEGDSKIIGKLYSISSSSFYFESYNKKLNKVYEGLPYFIQDAQPSGFLGSIIAKKHQDLGFPSDIRLWSEDHCIFYLANFAWDSVGNLILGDTAFQIYLERREKINIQIVKDFILRL